MTLRTVESLGVSVLFLVLGCVDVDSEEVPKDRDLSCQRDRLAIIDFQVVQLSCLFFGPHAGGVQNVEATHLEGQSMRKKIGRR